MPVEIAVLKALVQAQQAQLQKQDQALADQDAELRSRALLIEKLKHQLAGLKRHRFGAKSEHLDQLALALEDEEISQARQRPDDAPATPSRAKTHTGRKKLPDDLQRRDQVLAPEGPCEVCGGKLKKLGEDVTEELEYVPGHFVVNRFIRPRFACACCEQMHQAELPSRPIYRGRPGPGLLAHLLVSKYCDHVPLYRQNTIYARSGIELNSSTLSGWVGQITALLEPLAEEIRKHVLGGDVIFADDTPVPVLAPGSGKTKTARLWAYVRDERGFGSETATAAWYQFSRDWKAAHLKKHLKDFEGWMHADGYTGFNDLFATGRIREVACMAHIRRKFFDVHNTNASAIAKGALERIAELYQIEQDLKGNPPTQRAEARQRHAAAKIDDLDYWFQAQLPKISGKLPLAKAIRYAHTRFKKLRPYLEDGRLEIDNNTAERAIRGIGMGKKNWLFAGSEGGGKAAAIAYTLIETCKLNNIDPQAWLTDTLTRIADHNVKKIDEFLPWKYKPRPKQNTENASDI